MNSYAGAERLLTVAEVAELLHIHPNTLRRWADEGRIAAYRITVRGDRRFRPSDVEDFLNEFNPYLDKKYKPEEQRTELCASHVND
jgi:excisionase family DNA binding protein